MGEELGGDGGRGYLGIFEVGPIHCVCVRVFFKFSLVGRSIKSNRWNQ